jgi:hypothetical protein
MQVGGIGRDQGRAWAHHRPPRTGTAASSSTPFIYAHGYSADQRIVVPFPKDLTPANLLSKVNMLFQATLIPILDGYASVTTDLPSAG